MNAAERISLSGIEFDALTTEEVVSTIFQELRAGRGGRVATPNVDIVRAATRHESAAALLRSADLVVADGMPIIWASRLSAGAALPERVAGSTLSSLLVARAAEEGVTVLLVGGRQGVAQRAALAAAERHKGLQIGWHFPPFGFESAAAEMAALSDVVAAHTPGLILCGLGFPRQDRVCAWLYDRHPASWFLGCGGSLAFLAGEVPRAPGVLQAAGLEWIHRLALEPRRLARRYLLDDIPFALRLLAGAALTRC